MKIYKMIPGVFLTLILSTSAYSANLVIDNGQLIGADGITFEDSTGSARFAGSVRFVDGTCENLFDGCNDPSDLVFQTLTGTGDTPQELAVAASRALLEQVFDANPLYDIDIELTFGCGTTTIALVFCGILTPYGFTVNDRVLPAVVTNRDDNTRLDSVTTGSGRDIDASTIVSSPDRLVYADWTITAVPVPAAVWLFASGLLGLIGIARRNKAA